jgi:hypothetical protein
MYTLEDGSWAKLSPSSEKSSLLLALLEDPSNLMPAPTEWATAYDDPPRDAEEAAFGVGVGRELKLMAYRGRFWEILPAGVKDPYEDGIDTEIESYSCNDVGSCCYYEKEDGVFKMVIG